MGGLTLTGIVRALAALACALAVAGCGSSPSVESAGAEHGAPHRGGTAIVAAAKEPPILNFWLAPGAMTITQQITDGLSDPLVVLDDEGAWKPVLATSVPTLDNGGVVLDGDGMRVTFDLQPVAAWSDGVPITCEDVRFTWQVMVDPDNQIATRLGWERIEAVDCPTSQRVVIRFARRYAPYLSRILAWPPLPAHALRGKDFDTFWNDRITVSSGPYVFEDWQRGVRMSMRRNEHWWRMREGVVGGARVEGGALLDRIVFRFVKDANTLKMQLRMQEADMAFIPADTNLEHELESTPDLRFEILPGAVIELLVMRTDNPPLDDVRVRRALGYAIDRKMITDVILSGVVPPAASPMVSTQQPVYEDTSFERYAPDPERVSRLLTAAGYTRSGNGQWQKGGAPLTLEWVAGAGSMPFRAKVAQLVQEQLRRQGITTHITLIPSELLYSNIAPHGKFHLGEWSELTGAEPLPNLIYGCGEIPREPTWAGKNRAAWCNRDADERMSLADEEVDPARRADVVRGVEATIADEVPMLPLFQSPDVIAWRTSLHGVRPNPTANHTWNVEQWWVQP